MSEGQHQDSLRLFQKVPLTDKDDSYNSQLHLLITREYFCSLSHEPPDTLWGMEDLHHHTHLAGESVNSGPTGVINIRVRTQTHVATSHPSSFRVVTHTPDTRVWTHTHTADAQGSSYKSMLTEVHTGAWTRGLGLQHIFHCGSSHKPLSLRLSGCISCWRKRGEKSKNLLDSSHYVKYEVKWNEIKLGMRWQGFSIWQKTFGSHWPDCHPFITCLSWCRPSLLICSSPERPFWKGMPLLSQSRKALCPRWASSLHYFSSCTGWAPIPAHPLQFLFLGPISYTASIFLEQLCPSSAPWLCALLSPLSNSTLPPAVDRLSWHSDRNGTPASLPVLPQPWCPNQLIPESQLQTCGKGNLINALCPVGLLSLQPLSWSFAGLSPFSLVCSPPALSPPGDLGGALSLPYLHHHTDNLRLLIWAQHPQIHWPAWFLTYISVSETLIISCTKQSLGPCHPPHPTPSN